ncbi:hypothetical protein [Pseudanabaena sp. 'Roaring Creek']|uniref:hypothetical protein n=1 Tax=Pseudanabaena sp. 'Roaring Creek' TaxID=1681830 RepID=UPI000A654757|nr:hypothetical protein [Pseudanabaena sp. 'Roaring Creek']
MILQHSNSDLPLNNIQKIPIASSKKSNSDRPLKTPNHDRLSKKNQTAIAPS